MGTYDGLEIYGLVGDFLIHKLSRKFDKKDIGLYRYDRLAVLGNIIRTPQSENILKVSQALFCENDLKVVLKWDMKVVSYDNRTWTFSNGTYQPLQKENVPIIDINKECNHPPSKSNQPTLLI